MRFSILFFAATPDSQGADRYRVFTRAVDWAEARGADAVWVPERHFTEFGGLFPNPVVPLAYAAARTQRLRLRAGSVILPLHHPVRVVEDWSMLDNLSGGRVEISFGSGWNANDFVLNPGHFEDRREYLSAQMEEVRRAWRGEPVTLSNGVGAQVELVTLPRPLQPELPMWLTVQSDSSFAWAGRQGYPILTNLNFTKPAQLRDRVSAYREGAREGGRGPGWVALMVHSFVGTPQAMDRLGVVSALARYLVSNLEMKAQVSKARGVELSATSDQLRQLADDGARRLREAGSLLCSPDELADRVTFFEDLGVDELALLVDFLDDPDAVVQGLDPVTDVLTAADDARLPSGAFEHRVNLVR
jgi:natural product biosynthesis luciferase-like monooxygenase protein